MHQQINKRSTSCIKASYGGFLILAFLALTGCKEASKNENSNNATPDQKEKEKAVQTNYVSDGYNDRSEGYDWVAVMISRIDPDKLKVKIRSRADKKKPTCTLDVLAYKANDSIFTTAIDGKEVLFELGESSLMIKTRNPEDKDALMFYCSGGANVVGIYQKIEGELDQLQIDKRLFTKVLMLQGIGFNISSIKEGEEKKLTVAPFGLELVNRPETQVIEGDVTDAEIEDLNSDGSPEVLIYTTSDDEHKYGHIYGYSVNNKKSMSQIYFPPIANDEEINSGYMGHDEFRIVETSLVRRFPIFEENSTDPQRTGKVRQIQYKLEDGEALRKFVVRKVTEY